MKKTIVFVILHYMTDKDTIECVNSITERIDTEDYHIIIVDNASSNDSIEKIKQSFEHESHVTILINEENLGYAKGLNVGIKYAKEHHIPEFIVTMNNDILFLQKNFCNVLNIKYNEYKFAVAGPMMITSDGMCSVNPVRNTIRSVSEVKHLLRRNKILLVLCDFYLIFLYNGFKRIRQMLRKNKKNMLHLYDQVDYQLHGACWIFSDKYFEVFDMLDDSTFLYGEESILYLHLMKNKLKTLYTPELFIYHKEDSSTDSLLKSKRKKIRFVCKVGSKSLKEYLRIYQEYEK